MPTRWRGEPRNHGDIKHIPGCISPNGCRCAGHEFVNAPDTLPDYLRRERESKDPEGDAELPPWEKKAGTD